MNPIWFLRLLAALCVAGLAAILVWDRRRGRQPMTPEELAAPIPKREPRRPSLMVCHCGSLKRIGEPCDQCVAK
jgi:hypothetical protein